MTFQVMEGFGCRKPRVLVINGMPTSQEMVNNRSLSGPIGIITRDLMNSAGLEPNPHATHSAWYTYVITSRLARGAVPTDEQIKLARPWLKREHELLSQPKVIVTIGSTALKAVGGIKNYRSVLFVSGFPTEPKPGYTLWPMIDPAYALKHSRVQAQVEKDWMRLDAWLSK